MDGVDLKEADIVSVRSSIYNQFFLFTKEFDINDDLSSLQALCHDSEEKEEKNAFNKSRNSSYEVSDKNKESGVKCEVSGVCSRNI